MGLRSGEDSDGLRAGEEDGKGGRPGATQLWRGQGAQHNTSCGHCTASQRATQMPRARTSKQPLGTGPRPVSVQVSSVLSLRQPSGPAVAGDVATPRAVPEGTACSHATPMECERRMFSVVFSFFPKNSAAPWASRSRNERGPEDKGVNGDKSVPRSSWLSEGERGRSVRGQSATPGVPFLDFIWTESCSGQGSSPPETSAQVSAAFWR